MTQPQALSHIRVLDLSRILAGPWASQIFADLGAEVIKIERPGKGDDTRKWGPPFLTDDADTPTDESAYFLSANRGKQSVAVDIGTPEGQDLVRRLALNSDILLENYKVDGLKKYGLDFASLQTLNPRLIYCSITGFGQTGPMKDRAGYDFLIQGMGGLMGITGEMDGHEGAGPQKAGVALADILTGLYASTSILAALAYRDKTGEGQHIDLSLLDVQTACLANQAMNFLVSGETPTRLGNAHPNIVPYQTFATADGHIILAIGNDEQFGRFCRAAGLEHLTEHPDFSTNQARVENRESLIPLLAARLARETSDSWLETLEKINVPCGPINTIAEVFENPQIRHRQMQIDLPHKLNQKTPGVGSPIKLSRTPVSYHRAAPMRGEHTDEVLSGLLELDTETLERLRTQGVIE